MTAAGARRPKVKPMTPGIPRAARVRAYLTGAVITVGLVGISYRAWGLQVGDGARYRELAERQHVLSVDIPAPRGDIVDTRGRALAVSADAESVWANPRAIRDVTASAARLAQLIGGEPIALEAKLASDRRFVWLARHVAPQVARAVRAARLPGIEVAREPRRWYPAREIGAPVIGRAGIDGAGLEGIELALDDALTGTRGVGSGVRDARGRRLFADGLAPPEPGASVTLTLDRSIQAIADRALAETVVGNKAVSGVAVVLDVATSRVLAMASYPSYDPNAAGRREVARNRAITDTFEAGSVMKIFTISAALDAGVVAPDTELDVQLGALTMGPKTFRDVHVDRYLTVAGIVKRSSNVGTIKIAQRLGRERLYSGMLRFGFGARTGIELPGEQPGTLRDGRGWREIELATIGFGYGMTVTPLQLAAATAAIGNGGSYRAPRIVERIAGADGIVRATPAPEPRQAVSPATAAQMRAMLETVFEGGRFAGTASTLIVPGFRCGGKTGTARKYDPVTREYATDRYLSTFAGLAPIDRPRLAIAVFIDEPSGVDYYGGKVAGPVFATIASESLRYLGVPGEPLTCPPPAQPAAPAGAIVPPRTCVTPFAAARRAPVPAPAQPAPAPPAGDGAAAADPAQIAVPDFRGMGVGRALDVARAARLAVAVSGTGRVIAQRPPPGPAPAAVRIILTFSDGESGDGGGAAQPR